MKGPAFGVKFHQDYDLYIIPNPLSDSKRHTATATVKALPVSNMRAVERLEFLMDGINPHDATISKHVI